MHPAESQLKPFIAQPQLMSGRQQQTECPGILSISPGETGYFLKPARSCVPRCARYGITRCGRPIGLWRTACRIASCSRRITRCYRRPNPCCRISCCHRQRVTWHSRGRIARGRRWSVTWDSCCRVTCCRITWCRIVTRHTRCAGSRITNRINSHGVGALEQ